MLRIQQWNNRSILIENGYKPVACAIILCACLLSSNARADTINLRCTGHRATVSFVTIDEGRRFVRLRSITPGKNGSEAELTMEFVDGEWGDAVKDVSMRGTPDHERAESIIRSMLKTPQEMRQFVHIGDKVVTFGMVYEGREISNSLDRRSGVLNRASFGVTETCSVSVPR
jgi:hypothetical protein